MQLQGDIANNLEQITHLINKEIPEQSRNLADNVTNLEKVAQYCEDIYVNSKEAEKQHLLNETKSYTAQALASIAYQIHVLANNFLSLLDNQSTVVNDMNTSMHHLAHEVSIHKEKVARREIGILTTNKCIVRTSKVKRPEVEEKPVKYIRKPIDYSLLDDIGHGVKLSKQNTDQLSKIGVGRNNSYSSTHSSSGVTSSIPVKPADPNTPPLMLKANTIMSVNAGNGLSTVRSTASSGSSYHYRTPVIPPSVPSEYLSRQELGIYSSKKELNQSAGSESLSAAYGSSMSYRRPSHTNTNNLNNSSNQTPTLPMSEYSDTMDRRMANTYLNNNNSVGYASGKDIGIIRTNLNNIDYATNGTIYRRPQLHSSIYEHAETTNYAHNPSQIKNQRSGGNINNNNNNSSLLSNASSIHGLPPPPVLFANQMGLRSNLNQPDSSSINNGDPMDNLVFGDGDFLATNDFDEDVDDDLIPHWVPADRCIEKVITLFDYEGHRDDELSFKENMYIYVIKKNDDHWYEGVMKNENGEIVQGFNFKILLIFNCGTWIQK